MADVTHTGRQFGERLRALIAGIGAGTPAQPVTVDAFHRLIRTEPGLAMSRGQLYRLVDGSAAPPRLDRIVAFARYFNVPASYFLDDTAYSAETVAKIRAAVDDVDAMMQRLSELRVALVRGLDKANDPEA